MLASSIVTPLARSWPIVAVGAASTLELLLRRPSVEWGVTASGLALVLAAITVAVRRQWSRVGLALRAATALALLAAAGFGWPLVRTAGLDEVAWQERSRQALEATAAAASERLESIRATAADRAARALTTEDLESLVTPLDVGGDRLDVAVSVWRADSLLDWAGPVPGPERVGATDVPLVVDYGYRRYLIVQAVGDDGRRASCDVSLGLSDALFPRLGLDLAPGDWLAPDSGAALRLWPSPPDTAELPADALLRGVPAGAPWSWLELEAPRLAEQRRRAVEQQGRRVAVALLLGLAPLVVLAWRAWPGREVSLRGTLGILAAIAVATVLRILLERARVLDLALAPDTGTLSLLFLPTYFATSAGGGLLRSTADFVLTGLLVSSAVILLVPALRWLCARRSPGVLRGLVWGALAAGSVAQLGWIEAVQALVVRNANPLLIGLDSPFFTVPFLALHVGMLLLLFPLVVALLLGWERWFRGDTAGWLGLAAATAAIAARGLLGDASLVTTLWGVLLPVLGVAMRPAVQSPAFSRRVLTGLLALTWFAGVQSTGLERVYNAEKEEVALQDAAERLEPLDNWRRFLLRDVVDEIAADTALVRQLGDREADRSNLAFEIWARTLLPSQNFGCRVALRDDEGRLISEFDIGLPYEPTPLRNWRREAPMRQDTEVEAIELATEQGPFLVYRGRIDLEKKLPSGDCSRLTIDLPYAAAEGPIPLEDNVPVGLRLLGETPDRDLAPRRTFDEAVLIGHPSEGRVLKASSSVLVGLRLEDLPAPGVWTRLRLDGQWLHVARVERDGRQLVVAFEEPTLVERLLDLSRLAALYLAVATVAMLVFGLARLLRVDPRDRWPRALGVVGFEERLLASMLLIVLLPVFLLGVIQERRGAALARSENLEEVSGRLDTALQLLASNLDELAEALIRGEYVQDVIARGNTEAARALGPFAAAQVMVFDPRRELILDETLSDRDPDEAAAFLRQVEGGELMLEVDAFGWFLGRSYPVLGPNDRTYTVYVRRALRDEDLNRIARTIRTDLTLYDGSWAVVSSQAPLYRAGLRSPVLNAAALPVLRGTARRVVEAEQHGGLAVAQGYAVLAGPGSPQRGVLSARLFARASEDARERRRGQMFVFGLSSLALVLAVGAGLALSGRIVGPIRNLVAATDRIARGELDRRVPESGGDEIGQLVRAFNRMTDALNQSRRQLAARRSFLETVLGSLGAGVLVLDEHSEVLERNRAATALLGDDEGGFVRRLRALGPPEEPTDTEVVLGRADGPRTLRTVVSPARLESGRPGWLVVFDDVTELLASRRLALYAQMARQVAHEVKNPLTPIQLSAQMVRQAVRDEHPRLDEIVRENTGTIETQVERLRSIASEFSLLGRERLEDLGEIEIEPLLQEVRSLYPSPRADGAIETRVEGPLRALGSREALLKVLTNLVENARQAMGDRGTVRLEARSEGARVRIDVLDEGPGIDPDVQDRLFEPYFSTKSTGTGLGLVICRSLTEKMGGTIGLRNRTDRPGAVATLSLAAAPETADPGREASERNDSSPPV